MKRIISAIEVLGTFAQGEREYEVCATVDAGYEEPKSQLVTTLESYVRPVGPGVKDERLPAEWLPAQERIRESMPLGDALAAAREVFHYWVNRVRESVPLALHPS
jgi:hypothetical protein